MTDKEIIEAMPFLAKYCKKEYNDIRVDEVLLGAYDLINRQKAEIQALREDVHNRKTRENKLRSKIKSFRAEIDRLNSELKATSGAALSYKAEIERLTDEKENLRCVIEDLSNNTEYAKAEAVKEFMERLKTKKHECGCNYRKKPVYAVTEEKIDETYKEMVGEG